jgi:hypothetical protein
MEAIASLASALSYGEGKKMIRVYLPKSETIKEVIFFLFFFLFFLFFMFV